MFAYRNIKPFTERLNLINHSFTWFFSYVWFKYETKPHMEAPCVIVNAEFV